MNESMVNAGSEESNYVPVTLKCPITFLRINTAVRGYNCEHIQCFDLKNFLMTCFRRPRWCCPVCSNEIPFRNLRKDEFFQRILSDTSLPEDATVNISPNGTWSSGKSESGSQKKTSGNSNVTKAPAPPKFSEPRASKKSSSDIITLSDEEGDEAPKTVNKPVDKQGLKNHGCVPSTVVNGTSLMRHAVSVPVPLIAVAAVPPKTSTAISRSVLPTSLPLDKENQRAIVVNTTVNLPMNNDKPHGVPTTVSTLPQSSIESSAAVLQSLLLNGANSGSMVCYNQAMQRPSQPLLSTPPSNRPTLTRAVLSTPPTTNRHPYASETSLQNYLSRHSTFIASRPPPPLPPQQHQQQTIPRISNGIPVLPGTIIPTPTTTKEQSYSVVTYQPSQERLPVICLRKNTQGVVSASNTTPTTSKSQSTPTVTTNVITNASSSSITDKGPEKTKPSLPPPITPDSSTVNKKPPSSGIVIDLTLDDDEDCPPTSSTSSNSHKNKEPGPAPANTPNKTSPMQSIKPSAKLGPSTLVNILKKSRKHTNKGHENDKNANISLSSKKNSEDELIFKQLLLGPVAIDQVNKMLNTSKKFSPEIMMDKDKDTRSNLCVFCETSPASTMKSFESMAMRESALRFLRKKRQSSIPMRDEFKAITSISHFTDDYPLCHIECLEIHKIPNPLYKQSTNHTCLRKTRKCGAQRSRPTRARRSCALPPGSLREHDFSDESLSAAGDSMDDFIVPDEEMVMPVKRKKFKRSREPHSSDSGDSLSHKTRAHKKKFSRCLDTDSE